MTDERFDSILADCLQSVDEGRATFEDCVARYPGYAQQLEAHFALLARIRDAVPSVPAAAQTLGAERLQQAVVDRNNAAPRSLWPSPLRLLPKSLAVAFGAIILAGGAAGASAAVGGPNIAGEVISAIAQLPAQVRSAIGLEGSRTAPGQQKGGDAAPGEKVATAAPAAVPTAATAAAGPTATGDAVTPLATGGPSEPPPSAFRGLCQAYFAGGRRNDDGDRPGNRMDAQAFERLSNAAGAEGVDVFCTDILEQKSNGSPVGPTGAAFSTPTAVETPSGNNAGGNPNNNAGGNPNNNAGGNPNNNAGGNPNNNAGGNPNNNAGGNPDNNAGGNPDNNAGGNPDNNAGGNPDNNAGGNGNGNGGGNPKP